MIRDEIGDLPFSDLPSLPSGYYIVLEEVPITLDGNYIIEI